MFKKSLILIYVIFALLFSLNVRANITGAQAAEVSISSYEYNSAAKSLLVRGQYNTECDHNLRPQLATENDELVMYFTADGFEDCAISFSNVFEYQVDLPAYLDGFDGNLPADITLRLRDTSFVLELN